MKGKQAFLSTAIALSLVAGVAGCKDDGAAVSALEELTTQLSGQLAEGNEELTNLGTKLDTCMKDLATTKGEAAVITATDAPVETPSLEGEASLTSLEALKQTLNDTLTKQKAALSDLKTKVEQCAKDLTAAQEEAEAAAAEAEAAAAAEAEAAAAAEADAKKAAARKKRPAKKPTMVEEREAEGRPTTGTGSRYEKR